MWKNAVQLALTAAAALMLVGCAAQQSATIEQAPAMSQTDDILQQPLASDASGHTGASLLDDGTESVSLHFTNPEGWIPQPPQSSMRQAQFLIPAREPHEEDAELVVYYFGESGAGDVGANVERWCNQFQLADDTPPVEAAVITERTVNGRRMFKVDLTGRYVAPVQPSSDEYADKPDYRLLASILLSDHGPYYIKMLGPVWTVTAWASSFDEFVNQIR